jgi:hypothetical protein
MITKNNERRYNGEPNYTANKDTRESAEEGREGKGSEAKNPQLK